MLITSPSPYQGKVLGVPLELDVYQRGGRGGGKSGAMALDIVRWCHSFGDKAKVLELRESYKGSSDLEDTLEAMLVHAYGAGQVMRNRQEHLIRIARTGASIEFAQATTETFAKHVGRQWSYLCSEEAGGIDVRWFDKAKAGLRMPGVPNRVHLCWNPGQRSSRALDRRYAGAREPWAVHTAEDGSRFVLAFSTFRDNPFIDQALYEQRLVASAHNDPTLLRAWRDGESGDSDLFFSNVFGPWAVLDLPPGFAEVVRAYQRDGRASTHISGDHGTTSPLHFHVWVVFLVPVKIGDVTLPARSRIALAEVHNIDPADERRALSVWSVGRIADEVLAVANQWHASPVGVVDNSVGLSGEYLIDELKRFGLHLERPRKSRIEGWSLLKGGFANAHNRTTDKPWTMLSSELATTISHIEQMPRDKNRIEDASNDPADHHLSHSLDSLRYGALVQPMIATLSRPPGAAIF